MELVLYYIAQSSDLLISFLILVFIIGFICFQIMKNFDQEKKNQVIFYGLFLKIKNTDLIKLSTVFIKTFLVFYTMLVLEEAKIWICLIMIGIITAIYVAVSPKRAVYEIASTTLQVAMIYFIYSINANIIEINDSWVLLIVRTFSITLSLMFSVYLFFREVDIISTDRENKRVKNLNLQRNLSERKE